MANYGDVWDGAGDYEVTLTFAEDPSPNPGSDADQNATDPDGEQNATETSDGDSASDAADTNDGNETDTADESEPTADGTTPDGRRDTTTVTLSNPDEEKLGIWIAEEAAQELIAYQVFEDATEMGEKFEN